MKLTKTIFIFLFCSTLSVETGFSIENKQSQEAVIIKASTLDDPTLPYFKGLDTEFIKKDLSLAEKEKLRQQLIKLNPDRSFEEQVQEKYWNIKFYNKTNLPLIIGVIEDREKFSYKLGELGLRFLDLPIYMPNQGWRIPPQLEQFKEIIEKAVACERCLNPNFEADHYVYITVDQGVVLPHTSQRRAGWHGDSYRKIDSRKKELIIPVDHLYVVANSCPTLFVPGPFPFDEVDPEDVDQVLKHFSDLANDQEIIKYPDYTILRMDPYCVHDAGINESDDSLHRTFIKISISQSKYCKLGNAHNQLFIYDWPMLPRHNVPYTSDAMKQSAHRKDRDHFLEVNVRQIDFMKKTSPLPWTNSKILTIVRKGAVHAEKAKPGEILQTRSDDFLVTIFVAEEDDWKVTSQDGYQVFIPHKVFQNLYKQDAERSESFLPKQEIRRAVEVAEDIRFFTPTGLLEYAKKGSFLIYLNSEDIYTVPKEVFNSKYKIIEE